MQSVTSGTAIKSSYQPLPTHAVPAAKQIHKDHLLTAGHLVQKSRRGRVRLCWLAPQQFENLIRTTARRGFCLTVPTPGTFERPGSPCNPNGSEFISSYNRSAATYGEAARHTASRMVLRCCQGCVLDPLIRLGINHMVAQEGCQSQMHISGAM